MAPMKTVITAAIVFLPLETKAFSCSLKPQGSSKYAQSSRCVGNPLCGSAPKLWNDLPLAPFSPPRHQLVSSSHAVSKTSSALYASPQALAAKTAIAASSSAVNVEGLFYMFLLALQFGLQPVLTKRFTPQTVNRSTVVMAQDVVKFFMAGAFLVLSGNWGAAVSGWTIKTWLAVAGIPATLYCIQNMATLIAYQKLDPLTFNVLNQTKTLSAALCCFLIIGRMQSPLQVVSLFLLFASALIIEKVISLDSFLTWKKNSKKSMATEDSVSKETSTDEEKKPMSNHAQGVIAVLLASFISGLAGALAQKNLQSVSGCGKTGGRNSYLFTMELCVASMVFLLGSMTRSKDGERIRTSGFFDEWTPQTFIPIITNAAGGILVGLVTKYAGAVKKGFALIFGLLLSGVLQATMKRNDDNGGASQPRVSKEQVVGGILAALSLWLHSAYPILQHQKRCIAV
eukprot:CAMPEP_0195506952 /NCGR_PEP_ID=MMETSP0794_2-20130614/482_1 /TAXON_ID=515487 /ORGANISM="Stephanopyxis turris, Strain CCMP 815" /LENGTH=455 /DNA_ID=CAMNT_0040633439 /DNA_START=55 /DNA_END=1422 /DNA_ORIENTATION=+